MSDLEGRVTPSQLTCGQGGHVSFGERYTVYCDGASRCFVLAIPGLVTVGLLYTTLTKASKRHPVLEMCAPVLSSAVLNSLGKGRCICVTR